MIADSSSWVNIGSGIALAFITFMQVWQRYRQAQMQKTVDVIHTLTNSKMGEELFTGMVSAKALSAVDPTPENVALFEVAKKKWLDHQAKQATVDGNTNL